jgi:putative Holliday junction resolvase
VPQATPEHSALAFDYGERRIGVAFANPVTGNASAIKTVAAKSGIPDWQELDTLLADWQPAVIVVGVPYNMDGSESAMTLRSRDFASRLAERYGLPIEMVDERLTSEEAAIDLKEQRRQGIRTRRVRKEDIDSYSARLIAESWLHGALSNEQPEN